VIFHFATKAISWTADEGETWTDLEDPEWALAPIQHKEWRQALVVSFPPAALYRTEISTHMILISCLAATSIRL